jgi:putative ABC transport system permease protein
LHKPELSAIAERFDENAVILSSLMARRLGLKVGDRLQLSSSRGARTLQVLAVTDAVGFVPMLDTYRNSKTYAVVEAQNYPLLEPFAEPIGAALVLTESGSVPKPELDWMRLYDQIHRSRQVYATPGWAYETARRRETNRDFLIFDVIILLTSVLAAVGVANQLILAVHTRRRELALLRVLGMTADQIRKMLMMEGAFVGLLGGVMAVVLGIPLGFGSIAALKLVSAFEVRFELPWYYPPLVVAGAVTIALAAALYPARRAASARSAEFIHYE